MLVKFLRLALSNPWKTLRLAHPRRIKTGIRYLANDKGELQQVYRRYMEVYGFSDKEQSRKLLVDALEARPKGDVFCFPIIDWALRHQRPQHLALNLGKRGYRVFYFSTIPMLSRSKKSYELIMRPGENVFVCRLRSSGGRVDHIHWDPMLEGVRDAYLNSLQELMDDLGIRTSISILDHPYWAPLGRLIQNTKIVYDCMDHHRGFHEETCEMTEGEMGLIRDAEVVITSSAYLQEKVARIRSNILIRNGCEHALFSHVSSRPQSHAPVAGYVGAIARWFDIDLVAEVARQLQDWRFILVGSTVECDTRKAKSLPNIEFVGEVDYQRVPVYLSQFDVCMIPFKVTELTKATNPVKVYEYLSAGKPVVSTPLPEILLLSDKVFLASKPSDFAEKLRLARSTATNHKLVNEWRNWAKTNDWAARTDQFEAAISGADSRVLDRNDLGASWKFNGAQ